ncbi:hypothetical protein KJ937_01170 [Patescibacteria group bacterium]|nr:hypothetical protein [Patescibacteria group bacterium]
MPNFSERLSAMKAKQESGEARKKAEQPLSEREARRRELSEEREAVQAELSTAEQAAADANDAIDQAEAFAAEQGENLDSEAKAEIDAIKLEASDAIKSLESLKAEAARIDQELEGLAVGSETAAETPSEVPSQKISAEKPAEVVPEVPVQATEEVTAEKPAAEAAAAEVPVEGEESRELANEQAIELLMTMGSFGKNLNDAKTAEEVETAFHAISDLLDQMQSVKFPDKIIGPEGEESGKDIEDFIKSGESLKSFKLTRDVKLLEIKSLQEEAGEAPVGGTESQVGKPDEAVPEVPVEATEEVPAEEPIAEVAAAEVPVEKVSAETSAETAMTTEEAEEKIASLSFKDASKLANQEYENAGKDVKIWYSKILEGAGTVPDTKFANEQLNKIRQAQERMSRLGPAYVKRTQAEGKQTTGMEKLFTKQQEDLSLLATKIEDRVMLASENASEEKVLEQIHVETLQEDVDILDKQVEEPLRMAKANIRSGAYGMYKNEIAKFEEINSTLKQAVDSYTEKVKILANLARERRKEFSQLFDDTKAKRDEIVNISNQLSGQIERAKKSS